MLFRSLEVAGLAGSVVRNIGSGDVEAGKTSQAAQDEEGKEDVVGSSAQAEGEGDDSGCEAEGDLSVINSLAFSHDLLRGSFQLVERRFIPDQPANPVPVPSCCSSSAISQRDRP